MHERRDEIQQHQNYDATRVRELADLLVGIEPNKNNEELRKEALVRITDLTVTAWLPVAHYVLTCHFLIQKFAEEGKPERLSQVNLSLAIR